MHPRRLQPWLILLATTLLLPLADPALAEEVVTPASALAPADAAVAQAVERELRGDAVIPFDSIDVSVAQGIVTLEGSVDNLLARERAARQAQTVRGVRSVVNQLVVDTKAAIPDTQLHGDVLAALLVDPATDAYEVTVTVRDGSVQVDGTVDSGREKALVETVVRGVRGVRQVDNRVTVVPRAVRPSLELQAEIEQALRWDVYIDHALIGVRVEGNVAHLSGIVGSAAEKRLAIEKARVQGITDVVADDLQVAHWARDPRLRRDKYAPVDDQDIRAALHAALVQDPRVYSFDVKVDVQDGFATLRGVVDNLQAKRAAEQDARNTVGVEHVINLMKVRSPDQRTDVAIAADVVAALLRDPFTSARDIDVSVDDGIVRLQGHADSAFERNQADHVASRVRGVEDVVNRILVEDPNASYDPYVDAGYPQAVGLLRVPTGGPGIAMTDRALEYRIRLELFWSPFVDGSTIDVDVVRGVATLTGKVGSRMEWDAARENAYEAGANQVVNDLAIVSSETSTGSS